MAKNKNNTQPKKSTPFQQLSRELTNKEEQVILVETLMPLKEDYRDDFCLSVLAYIKFGVPRKFDNHMMQVIYHAFIELLGAHGVCKYDAKLFNSLYN